MTTEAGCSRKTSTPGPAKNTERAVSSRSRQVVREARRSDEEKRALEKAALIKERGSTSARSICEVRRRRNRAEEAALARRGHHTVVTGGFLMPLLNLLERTGSSELRAVLAKGRRRFTLEGRSLRVDDNNPLCVPPSFYSGAVLDFDEAQLAMDSGRPPDDADVEDAAARARKIRMEVSWPIRVLGSFPCRGCLMSWRGWGCKSPLQHWKEVRCQRPQ